MYKLIYMIHCHSSGCTCTLNVCVYMYLVNIFLDNETLSLRNLLRRSYQLNSKPTTKQDKEKAARRTCDDRYGSEDEENACILLHACARKMANREGEAICGQVKQKYIKSMDSKVL